MDTPGHTDFIGEVTAALRIADAAVLVVDAVEGVLLQTEVQIEAIVRSQVYILLYFFYYFNIYFYCFLFQKVPIIFVINKMDRYIVELKLPPGDAYHKIINVSDSICFIMNYFCYFFLILF